ncbi:MAG: transposase [Burkholderiales bacterium]|nr:transposase [Burkholderiales bacterium]
MELADGRRRRRRHSDEFKARVVQTCRIPGVSIAAVALANGLNANLLRRWVIAEEQSATTVLGKRVAAPEPAARRKTPGFIPLALGADTGAGQQIRLEIRQGESVVTAHWPLEAAGACANWLREVLR